MGSETSEVSNKKDTFRIRNTVVESRPTFIISNDDNFNLGHYMNDVMNVWQMAVLAGRSTKDSLLINFDGFRTGGPAGGPDHRLRIATRFRRNLIDHGPLHSLTSPLIPGPRFR